MHPVTIAGDHFQFFVGDLEHGPSVDTRAPWSDPSPQIGVAACGPHLLAVGTARYGGQAKIEVYIDEAVTASKTWRFLGNVRVDIPSERTKRTTQGLEQLLHAQENPRGYVVCCPVGAWWSCCRARRSHLGGRCDARLLLLRAVDYSADPRCSGSPPAGSSSVRLQVR